MAHFFITGLVICSRYDDEVQVPIIIIQGDCILVSLGKIKLTVVGLSRLVDDGRLVDSESEDSVAIVIYFVIRPVISLDYLIPHGEGSGFIYPADQRLVKDTALTQQPARSNGAVGQAGTDIGKPVDIGEIINRATDKCENTYYQEGKQQRYPDLYRHQLALVLRI